MALKHYNPTSPGQRGLVLIDRSELHKGRPEKKLVEGLTKSGGRGGKGGCAGVPHEVADGWQRGGSGLPSCAFDCGSQGCGGKVWLGCAAFAEAATIADAILHH